MFRKLLDEGQAGDNAGLLLRGVDKEDLNRGNGFGCSRFNYTSHEI